MGVFAGICKKPHNPAIVFETDKLAILELASYSSDVPNGMSPRKVKIDIFKNEGQHRL
jgi:hypothetical protein